MINVNSILKYKNVVNHIPHYFNNKKTPVICYSYKSLRNLIFNYGQEVFEYPSSSVNDWDCLNSKFCYYTI